MSVWSARRQVSYTLLILAVVFLVVGASLYVSKDAPSCSDGKKNQDEIAIDCGGSCKKVCSEETTDLVTRWVRVFKVKEGVYDIAARVDNPNIFGIEELAYHFKLYDENNVLVREARGTTFVNPDQSFIILATGVATGFQVPVKGFVEFAGQTPWLRYTEYKRPTFAVKDKELTTNPLPRLSVHLGNESLFDTKDIEVVAVILDENGNAIGASRTFVDRLVQDTTKEIFFTWPEPFDIAPSLIEVYPRTNTTLQVAPK